MRPRPRGDREGGLLGARELDTWSEDVVPPEHHTTEQLLVDEPHRFRRRERRTVFFREREARAPVVFPGARALERHQPSELVRAMTGEHVVLGAAEACEVPLREIDPA